MVQKYVVISRDKTGFQMLNKPVSKKQALKIATQQRKSLKGTKVKTTIKSLYSLGLTQRSKPRKKR